MTHTRKIAYVWKSNKKFLCSAPTPTTNKYVSKKNYTSSILPKQKKTKWTKLNTQRERERENCIHANNMASRHLIKSAITSDGALKSFHCNRPTPIPISTAGIFAKVPVFFPQSFRNLFQSPHCNSKQTYIFKKITFFVGSHQNSRIQCHSIWKLKFLKTW